MTYVILWYSNGAEPEYKEFYGTLQELDEMIGFSDHNRYEMDRFGSTNGDHPCYWEVYACR